VAKPQQTRDVTDEIAQHKQDGDELDDLAARSGPDARNGEAGEERAERPTP